MFITEAIKRFLAEFHDVDEDGRKNFKYAVQLVELAHRDQISLTIDVDDVGKFIVSWALQGCMLQFVFSIIYCDFL